MNLNLFDVNILIYAHRADQEHHEFYREYLEGIIRSGVPFGMSPLTAVGFVRIVTNPRFPNGPTPLIQALSLVDSLVSLEQCTWTVPGKRHWELTSELCRKTSCSGKSVADAQHAAIAIEHSCNWVTRDKDFVPFQAHGLRLELLEP